MLFFTICFTFFVVTKSAIKIFITVLFLGCVVYCLLKEDRSTIARKERIPNVVCLNFRQDPLSLDPRKGSDPISPSLHVMMLQGLTRMTPNNPHELSLAKTLSISEDRKTYTFTLKNCYWSDQSPITSYDFANSWREALDPHFLSPVSHLFFVIKNGERAFKGDVLPTEIGIHTPDDSTLIVELEEPITYFLELTSFSAFFPVKYEETHRKSPSSFLSSGPFLLQKWHYGDKILLEKNPYFWDAQNVQIEGIHINIVKSDLSSLQMFENGDIDFVGSSISPLPLDTLHILSKQGIIHSSPLGASTILAFNLEKFPYNNKNIRKAIAAAINRQELIENITQLNEIPATGPVPPVLKGNRDAALAVDGDPVLAKQQFTEGLQELGLAIEDFPPITITYYNEDCYTKLAQAIGSQIRTTLGVQVKLIGCELQYFLQKLKQRDFQIAEFSWSAQYNDPMNILERFKSKSNSKNYPGWENSTFTALLKASVNSSSYEERLSLLEKAEALFIEDMPLTCLYHWNSNYLLRPHIQGLYISPIGTVHWEFANVNLP